LCVVVLLLHVWLCMVMCTIVSLRLFLLGCLVVMVLRLWLCLHVHMVLHLRVHILVRL